MTAAAAPIQRGAASAWLLACRPATLAASVVPVLVGTSVAFALGALALGPALAALVGAVLIQVTTNFANDVFDFEKGADTHDRLGPTRAVQAGLLSARQMKTGMVAAIAGALGVGAYLVGVGGWPIVAIGAASLVSAVAYTGGPAPLGYLGLGDLFVMIFFGFVAVCGTVYVQALSVPPLAWAAAVPIGALSTAILVVNNLRDRETDLVANKRTLAVRFGAGFAKLEYGALVLVAYATPPVMLATGLGGAPVLLPLSTLPLAARRLAAINRDTGSALNAALGATARLLLAFGGLLAVGIAAS